MKKRIFLIIIIVFSCILSSLLGCFPIKTEKATIILRMHDAPIDPSIVTSVYLQVLRTEIIDQNDVKTVISNEEKYFDILKLKSSNPVVLSNTSIVPGTYKQIRLILGDNNSIVFTNGESKKLKVPSGIKSGIKLNGVFEIPAGKIFYIDLDFLVEKSIVQTKKQYILKPVIEIERVGDIVGNFVYSGVVEKDEVVIQLDPAQRVKLLTSTDREVMLTGVYYYNSSSKKLDVNLTDIQCISCSPLKAIAIQNTNIARTISINVTEWSKDVILGTEVQFNTAVSLTKVDDFKLQRIIPPSRNVSFTINNIKEIESSNFNNKILAVQLIPKDGRGAIHFSHSTIENDSGTVNFDIILSDFGFNTKKDYILNFYVVNSLDDIQLDAKTKAIHRFNCISRTYGVPIDISNITEDGSASMNYQKIISIGKEMYE